MVWLRRAYGWVRAWRSTRWAALTFVIRFVPDALKWMQQVYEFFAAGPNSGRQLPGLSTLGYAAAAASLAVVVGALGFLTDMVAKVDKVPLQESKPAASTATAVEPPVQPLKPGDIPIDQLVPPANPGPILGAQGGSGGVLGGHGAVGLPPDGGGGFR